MVYTKEQEMYPDVVKWLEDLLTNKFKGANIIVQETSKKILSRFLLEKGLHNQFPEYQTYEIEVDVTGIIQEQNVSHLAFVECKLGKITLRDISQLLGYSRVANPLLSIILSPKGLSNGINLLLSVHRRNDILRYSNDRFIHVATWVQSRQDIDMGSLFPRGSRL